MIGNPVLFAEFESPEALLAAITVARRHGCGAMEAYTPYPVPALEGALDLRPSRLPWAILIAGLLGASFAYFLQWWLHVRDYPLLVGGTPFHAGPAFIPITFETTVLFAGLTAFFGFLAATHLPRLWHYVFEVEGFESATLQCFWLELRGDGFDVPATKQALVDAGARRIEVVGGTTG